MGTHWSTPESRGVYQHPDSIPPTPQHRTTNDYGARLARLEEHIQFSAHNTRRIETDSLKRASDITGWMTTRFNAIDMRIAEVDRRTRILEDHILKSKAGRQAIQDLVTGSGNAIRIITSLLKWMSVAAVAYLLIRGHITVDAAKLLLGAFGLPTGS